MSTPTFPPQPIVDELGRGLAEQRAIDRLESEVHRLRSLIAFAEGGGRDNFYCPWCGADICRGRQGLATIRPTG